MVDLTKMSVEELEALAGGSSESQNDMAGMSDE